MDGSRWPNLFVVGAAKAGTTSLYAGLADHPDVFMSPLKEPHFFSRIQPDPALEPFFPHVRSEREYLALFSGAGPERFLGEASTSYLWDPLAAARISEASPEARIVIMLREPVGRAYSHYWNDVREGVERRSFREAVADELRESRKGWGVTSLYVDCSRYPDAVERYRTLFGERVHVLFFEEFADDVRAALTGVFRFLDVEPGAARDTADAPRNALALPRNELAARVLGTGAIRRVARAVVPARARSRARRLLLREAPRPPLDPETRRLLENLFRSDRARLEELLGRRTPW